MGIEIDVEELEEEQNHGTKNDTPSESDQKEDNEISSHPTPFRTIVFILGLGLTIYVSYLIFMGYQSSRNPLIFVAPQLLIFSSTVLIRYTIEVDMNTPIKFTPIFLSLESFILFSINYSVPESLPFFALFVLTFSIPILFVTYFGFSTGDWLRDQYA